VIEEKIKALGHPNVTCAHKGTAEFTAEKHLTLAGDCIFAVCADKTLADLRQKFRDALQMDGSILEVEISTKDHSDMLRAYGSSKLSLDHPTDFVIRKSRFICSRTLAIEADKGAVDLKRELVSDLKDGCECIIKLNIM
jgi:hypothetical protein